MAGTRGVWWAPEGCGRLGVSIINTVGPIVSVTCIVGIVGRLWLYFACNICSMWPINLVTHQRLSKWSFLLDKLTSKPVLSMCAVL